MTDDARERQREALAEDARLRFASLYERLPSWDVPVPQPAFIDLHRRGEIRGLVLDAGCGTGENALWLAERGLDVWGVDIVDVAIGMARAKATTRRLPASRFLVADALALGGLGMVFDTVVDSGLFHAFTDAEREHYRGGLEVVLKPGGLLHILGFSDAQPGDTGPRRIARHEFAACFASGWRVVRVDEARFMTNIHAGGARAWIATIERLPVA